MHTFVSKLKKLESLKVHDGNECILYHICLGKKQGLIFSIHFILLFETVLGNNLKYRKKSTSNRLTL